MEKQSRIYVAGVDTLIGVALSNGLHRQGYMNITGGEREDPDLTDIRAIDTFFDRVNPEYIFLVAGKSGGIVANQKYPASLMLNNLLIECHVIQSAYLHGVKKLLYLASSCCYPRECPQPMREEYLFNGPLEPTSEAYAVAKMAGIKLCQGYRQQYGVHFITGIPADVFGAQDDFSREDSHVVAALISRMHEAKLANADSMQIWGTGSPRRDFIFADDLADACIFIMKRYDEIQPINLGSSQDISIKELALTLKEVTGYRGELRFDPTKPDGMPVKILDSSKLRSLGWRSRINFRVALEKTYDWFQSH